MSTSTAHAHHSFHIYITHTKDTHTIVMQITRDISLLHHNTFGIDIKAKALVRYDSAEELTELVRRGIGDLPVPLLHIGEGSNLLFMSDFEGTVLLSNIREVEIVSEENNAILVRVGSGWKMDEFIAHAISQGWYGLENLSHIPGQVGASAVQNIGAYGVEAGDMIHAVNCISLEDGSARTFTHQECAFAYRHSIFKTPQCRGRYAVVSVEYALSRVFSPNLEYRGIRQSLDEQGISVQNLTAAEFRKTIVGIRENKLPDPKIQGNAGSFFMNPVIGMDAFKGLLSRYPEMPHYEVDADHVKIPAAWLIEQCGWKGKALGPAGVHARQPLVLVNLGGAKGADIQRLSSAIQADVYDKFNINIHPEVNFI